MGRVLYGLLGSGASVTILGGKGWSLLDGMDCFWVDKAKALACTVTNGDACQSIRTVTLPFELEGRREWLPVVIKPSLEHSLILGLDFFRKFGVVPNLRNQA